MRAALQVKVREIKPGDRIDCGGTTFEVDWVGVEGEPGYVSLVAPQGWLIFDLDAEVSVEREDPDAEMVEIIRNSLGDSSNLDAHAIIAALRDAGFEVKR